jgi:hypothetical protein
MLLVRMWNLRAGRLLLLLVLFGYLAYRYCGAYFPLDAHRVGGPGDFEPYSALDWVVAKTLREHHSLPLWNPYVHNGVPFIGDPYISFFNPFVVLPLFFFGPIDGAKVAVGCAVALAGLGQYWLSRVLGQGRAVSLVAGVVGLASGSLVAPAASGFSFGHTVQFAWIAPTIASFILAVRSPRPRAIALAAASYALLFHAGNLYYWLVTSGILAIIAAGYGIAVRTTGTRGVRLEWRTLLGAAAVAGTAFLLVAPQAVPMLALRRYAEKPIDVAFRGTQPPLATLFNLVIPDPDYWKAEPLGATNLGWAVYYSYLGGGVFLLLLFLVPAILDRRGRDLPLLLLGFGVSLAWASARHTFMWEVWKRWDVMQQLRFWSTAMGVGTVLLIPLAMAGADYLWRRLAAHGPTLDRIGPRLVWCASASGAGDPGKADGAGTAGALGKAATAAVATLSTESAVDAAAPVPDPPIHAWSLGLLRVALWGALVALLLSVALDPWTTNRRLWNTRPYNVEGEAAFAWLRDHDQSAFGVWANQLIYSFASAAQLRYELQAMDSVWPFEVRPVRTPRQPGDGLLVASPKYILTRRDAPPPANASLLKELDGITIYTAPPGLPFAFTVAAERLPYGAAGATALAEGQIQEATARWDGPNRVVVQAPAGLPADPSALVVMQSWMPGWTAKDSRGATHTVRRAGGFLAIADARPGERYVLSFLPGSFIVGSALGTIGLAALALFAWADRQHLPWHARPLTEIWPRRGAPDARGRRSMRPALPGHAASAAQA